tara:strand:- start:1915 stop:2370 length:456 start_codon:yes stop_codon:yes gene_type:complete
MSPNIQKYINLLPHTLFVIWIVLIIVWVWSIPEINKDNTDPTLIDRIKPLGEVYVEGDTSPRNDKIENTVVVASSRSGEEVYNSSCSACHSSGVLGAPKAGNKDDWSSRLEGGISALLKSSISGKGAMPPKGTCGSCSDDELLAAIEFMVN